MKLKRSPLLALVILFALCAQGFAQIAPQPSAEVRQASARLAGAVLVGGRSMDYLKELTDGFGARLSGSPAYERSAEWAAEQFRAAGLKDVRLEEFTLDAAWQRGEARGRIVAPFERKLHVESLGWSPSTPKGGVRGEVVVITDISPAGIKSKATQIKGRVVALDLTATFAQGIWKAYTQLLAMPPMLKDAGATALVAPRNVPNNVHSATSPGWGSTLSVLPTAEIGMEDWLFIERLLQEQPARPVTVEFSYDNRTAGRTITHNVVAEIRGREKPDEWVIVGAHLDSWDYATGAQDNGSGVAQVLEAARAIIASGQTPRRSIRFALWGGEEQGLLGSAAYARAHASELKNCVAALNTDNGAGHPQGWKYQGREDVKNALGPISELLKGLGGDKLSEETTFDTDHGHFMLAGIPALDLLVDMTHYEEVHHKASDTLDKVGAHELAAGAAIIAVTAYAIAEQPERIAPHLDANAVGEILKKAELEDFLKAIGVWKP